jgi:hypothetical protein
MQRVMDHVVADISYDNSSYESVLVLWDTEGSDEGKHQSEIDLVSQDHGEHKSPTILWESVMDAVNEEVMG